MLDAMTGLSTRTLAFTDDGVADEDVRLAASLVRAHEVALLGAPETTEDELRDWLGVPWTDREASCIVLVDGEPAAATWVTRDDLARQSFLVVNAPPGAHHREVSAYALDRALEAARRHAEAAGVEGWSARSGSWIEDAEHFELLEERGFTPVRRFYQMLIESSSPAIPAAAPPLPPGVEIVVARDEDAYRTLYDVDCASFVDHWNFVAHPYDEWRTELVDSPNRDPDGLWLLTVDGAPAGICALDHSRLSEDEGYVAILGVLQEFRGRGLASLLLQHAFVRDRERGLAGTRLGVDAENTTGAVGVYEKVGMRAVRTRQGWIKPL
jgi:ribosomal protein S18 acetylase RimI-like enzyme